MACGIHNPPTLRGSVTLRPFFPPSNTPLPFLTLLPPATLLQVRGAAASGASLFSSSRRGSSLPASDFNDPTAAAAAAGGGGGGCCVEVTGPLPPWTVHRLVHAVQVLGVGGPCCPHGRCTAWYTQYRYWVWGGHAAHTWEVWGREAVRSSHKEVWVARKK